MLSPLTSRHRPRVGLPLVVGAGPTGLMTAFMLARDGAPVRIIDKADTPTANSRALLINHRTLDLLEESGLAERLLRHGHRLRGLVISVGGYEKARLPFTIIPHEKPFLLTLPQNITERILEDALREKGILIERHTEFVAAHLEANGCDIDLKTGGSSESGRMSWLIGADGGQSSVRQAMGIDAPAARAGPRWSMVDVELGGEAEQDHLELCFARGAPFMARIPMGRSLHRVMANASGVADMLPDHWEPGQIIWAGECQAGHHMANRRMVGRAALVGEAAHHHDPLGGRGLNLGIEDAVTLAMLIRETSAIDPKMITKAVEDQIKNRLRQWERERLSRARSAMEISERLEALTRDPSFLKLWLVPLAIRMIGLLPSVRRDVLSLLTELKRS